MRNIIIVAALAGGTAGTAAGLLKANDNHDLAPVVAPLPVSGADTSGKANGLEQLKVRIAALEVRVSQLLADRRRPFSNAQPDSKTVSEKRTAANQARNPASKLVPAVDMLVEQLEQDESPIRRAVSGIVRDQMQNRMEEWRAFRTARGEARDEERVERLGQKVQLTADQRRGLLDLLASERDQRRILWREARETMDIKSSRQKTQALREQTDESAADILGAEDFGAWKELRQEGRRWRR